MKKALILGGGVAGCSLSYLLTQLNFDCTIINERQKLGGLARTEYYAGHPYEFGPHIWFWPGGLDSKLNQLIHKLSDGELNYIKRKLVSYIESDNKTYRYPIHYDDINEMKNSSKIKEELSRNRDKDLNLIEDKIPTIGEATFKDYFEACIGPNLYHTFMKNYTEKMWNIPGEKLETSMVWADRFNHAYSNSKQNKKFSYDPIKFKNHTLGADIEFQIYPKLGWNKVWQKMSQDANLIVAEVKSIRIVNKNAEILLSNEDKIYTKNYDLILNTLDLDFMFGDKELPYTGRMILPFLIPDNKQIFNDGIESIHYSGAEFMTRVTEMKSITRYESDSSLLLIEVPILPGLGNYLPKNVLNSAKSKNLYSEKAYPQQSKEAIAYHERLAKTSNEINNWHNIGRHAQFKYWGMPETVNSAVNFVETLR